MADTFKLGDTVQLKSGGPVMTVEEINEKTGILCQWFSEKEIKRARFRPETLTKAEHHIA